MQSNSEPEAFYRWAVQPLAPAEPLEAQCAGVSSSPWWGSDTELKREKWTNILLTEHLFQRKSFSTLYVEVVSPLPMWQEFSSWTNSRQFLVSSLVLTTFISRMSYLCEAGFGVISVIYRMFCMEINVEQKRGC